MFRHRHSPDFTYYAAIAGIVVLAIVVVALLVKDCKDRRACEEHGGIVVETNCRWVTNCHSDGNGHTTCTADNVCDWRCDMSRAPAESPR